MLYNKQFQNYYTKIYCTKKRSEDVKDTNNNFNAQSVSQLPEIAVVQGHTCPLSCDHLEMQWK